MSSSEDKAARARRVFAEIEADPVAAYRSFRGDEADELAKMPGHMQPGLARYILLGIKPGSFLRSIFANEFELAAKRADEVNLPALPAYRHFLKAGCPKMCWGSSDHVRDWCESGGLLGLMKI